MFWIIFLGSLHIIISNQLIVQVAIRSISKTKHLEVSEILSKTTRWVPIYWGLWIMKPMYTLVDVSLSYSSGEPSQRLSPNPACILSSTIEPWSPQKSINTFPHTHARIWKNTAGSGVMWKGFYLTVLYIWFICSPEPLKVVISSCLLINSMNNQFTYHKVPVFEF